MILLAEAANHTKRGGQDLIGGLDVHVNRNFFGRQIESFEAPLDLPFLREASLSSGTKQSFHGVFIRAPVVEKLLPNVKGEQREESFKDGTVVAPSKQVPCSDFVSEPVEVLTVLPGRSKSLRQQLDTAELEQQGDIVMVQQGNVLGTSFHPELTNDARIHVWWLKQVKVAIESC